MSPAIARIIFKLKITLNTDKTVFKTNRKIIIPTEPKKFLKRKTRFLLKDKNGTSRKNSCFSVFLSNMAGNQNIVRKLTAQKTLPA